MRVSIYEADSKYELEGTINKQLECYDKDDIVDIKYTGNGSMGAYSNDKYSAMIIFK